MAGDRLQVPVVGTSHCVNQEGLVSTERGRGWGSGVRVGGNQLEL